MWDPAKHYSIKDILKTMEEITNHIIKYKLTVSSNANEIVEIKSDITKLKTNFVSRKK